MNSHERAILENFLNQLVQVRGIQKLPQADTMIRRAVDRQPDADYLLVQRSLVLEQALDQARARIAELEAQQRADRSFLDPGTSGAPASVQQTTVAAAPQERPQAGQPGSSSQLPSAITASPPVSAEVSRGGGAPSFLGQAAATATGVAGGAFLFEGIENLFSPHGTSAPGHEAQSFIPEDVTINNYYARNERPNQADDDRSDRLADDEPAADDDAAFHDDDSDLV